MWQTISCNKETSMVWWGEGKSWYFDLKVRHPRCVESKMQCIKLCVYSHIHTVKTQQICQIVLLYNKQHYVTYNYMFRPCKRAIIRLLTEPSSRLHKNSCCVVCLMVLWTAWWWPACRAETCSCYIAGSVAHCIVIISDKFVVFWLYVYVNIHVILYIGTSMFL